MSDFSTDSWRRHLELWRGFLGQVYGMVSGLLVPVDPLPIIFSPGDLVQMWQLHLLKSYNLLGIIPISLYSTPFKEHNNL